jgi:hypothetical protein
MSLEDFGHQLRPTAAHIRRDELARFPWDWALAALRPQTIIFALALFEEAQADAWPTLLPPPG